MIYGGAYLLMLNGPCVAFDSGMQLIVRPEYAHVSRPIDSPTLEAIFEPAFAIDRQIRPNFWKYDNSYCYPLRIQKRDLHK